MTAFEVLVTEWEGTIGKLWMKMWRVISILVPTANLRLFGFLIIFQVSFRSIALSSRIIASRHSAHKVDFCASWTLIGSDCSATRPTKKVDTLFAALGLVNFVKVIFPRPQLTMIITIDLTRWDVFNPTFTNCNWHTSLPLWHLAYGDISVVW